jgi:hypothetical protein
MLSANGIQAAQQALESSSLPFAAVSTIQRPSEEVRLRFPLFYEKKMMDEEAYRALIEDDKKWFAFLGSFGVMTKKTFAGVGGWMPEEIHEDMRFDNQIQLASLCYGSQDTAVIPGSFRNGIVTEFNPDRDLLALHDKIGGSRFVPELYYKTSGSRRVDWQQIPQSEDPTSLLSGELTAQGMISIAQQYIDSLVYKKPEYAKTAQAAVCRYLMGSGLLKEVDCSGRNAAGEKVAVKIAPGTLEALSGDIIIEKITAIH